MKIGNRTIGPGEEARIELSIAKLPTHTKVNMPVYVFRSEQEGPVLMLTAGIHGDEVNGTETIRRMLLDGSLRPSAGAVVVVPIVNVYGFLHHSRTLPDGRDLNRSFPGGTTGSLARRIAHVLMNQVLPNIDIGVDFHTGGARISNFPQIRCVFEDPKSLDLAQKFAAPLTLNSGLINKSFRKEAFKAGKSILVFEGGQSLQLDELAISEGIAGSKRLMQSLGIRDFSEKEGKTTVLQDSRWIRARISGLAVPKVEYGERVKEGQTLITLGDPFGEMLKKVKAPSDGIIVGINRKPVVNAGDALVHLGKVG